MFFSPVRNIIRNIIFVIISIILGVIFAIVFSNGAIIYLRSVVKADLILSSLLLAALVGTGILSFFMENHKIKNCLLGSGISLLIASIGSLVVGLIALGVFLDPTSLAIQILVGFGGFFFSLMILFFIAFIICLIKNTKPKHEYC